MINKFLENEHSGITNYSIWSSASSKLEPTTFNISKPDCREVNEQLTLLLSTPSYTMASRLATRALGAYYADIANGPPTNPQQAPPVSDLLCPPAPYPPPTLPSSPPASNPTCLKTTPSRKLNPLLTRSLVAALPPRRPSCPPVQVSPLRPSATRSTSSTRSPLLRFRCSPSSGLSLTMVVRCTRSGLRATTTRSRTF